MGLHGTGRRLWWGVGRAAGLSVPTSPRGPQPGPFPLLAAELKQERQHTGLRRLEALQKHEVSPGERGSLAGVQAATEMLFVRLWVPAGSPARLFRGAGSAAATQPRRGEAVGSIWARWGFLL